MECRSRYRTSWLAGAAPAIIDQGAPEPGSPMLIAWLVLGLAAGAAAWLLRKRAARRRSRIRLITGDDVTAFIAEARREVEAQGVPGSVRPSGRAEDYRR